jgi:hypothetical protein
MSRGSDFHEIAVAGIVGACIRQDQLDETDDDRQMVAEGVHGFRAEARLSR